MEDQEQNEIKNGIQVAYRALPPDIKTAIVSSNLDTALQSIMNKHGLTVEQASGLETETYLVMLGLSHPSAFVGNLSKTLAIDHEKTKVIAEDVNAQIFRPIRESLKKIHGIGEGTEEATEASVASKLLSQKEENDGGTSVIFETPKAQIATEEMMIPFQPPSIVRNPTEKSGTISFAAEADKVAEDLKRNAMQKTEVVTMPKEPSKEASAASKLLSKEEGNGEGTSVAETAPKTEESAKASAAFDVPRPQATPIGHTIEENETDLSREKILKEIENPIPAHSVSEKFFEDKMAGLVNVPVEKKEIKAPIAPATPPTPPVGPPPSPPIKNYPVDPYREPLK